MDMSVKDKEVHRGGFRCTAVQRVEKDKSGGDSGGHVCKG